MSRIDISNEIVTTLNTIVGLINTHVKESQMQQQAGSNIIQLRLPVRCSRAMLVRDFVDNINSLETWQKSQMLASLRSISKIIYGTAEECIEMAAIINALDK